MTDINYFFDRDYQRYVLHTLLNKHYPNHATQEAFASVSERKFFATMIYLEQHGLVELNINRLSDIRFPKFKSVGITEKGIDFILDDGGFSAILGVQVIKFHDDELKKILQARIDQSDLPPAEKDRLQTGLEKLGTAGLESLTKALLDKAVTHLPGAIETLRKALDAVL